MDNMRRAANAYKRAQVDATVLGASPHELIAILLAKAIESTNEAKRHMESGDIERKGQAIKLAIAIISDGLRGSLNLQEGGEIAANLNMLYEYMTEKLLQAHAENNAAMLDEVVALLGDIKAGWDGIKPQHATSPQLQPQA